MFLPWFQSKPCPRLTQLTCFASNQHDGHARGMATSAMEALHSSTRKALIHVTHQPGRSAVSEIDNGMLGLAQRAACDTRTHVSTTAFGEAQCSNHSTAMAVAREQECIPNKLALRGCTAATSLSLPLPLPLTELAGLALYGEGG